ncbi:MAG TPA: hypothetical protein VJ065_02790 [Patescibacteria group bacterium]|nr:hypothetical protein [Patescibacteria group bacterium]
MPSLNNLEKRIKLIEERNRRVEKDKEWEISLTRRVLLIAFTYLAIGFYLSAINVSNPWLNAIVPSLAFWLSTLTLPIFKKLWEKYLRK